MYSDAMKPLYFLRWLWYHKDLIPLHIATLQSQVTKNRAFYSRHFVKVVKLQV